MVVMEMIKHTFLPILTFMHCMVFKFEKQRSTYRELDAVSIDGCYGTRIHTKLHIHILFHHITQVEEQISKYCSCLFDEAVLDHVISSVCDGLLSWLMPIVGKCLGPQFIFIAFINLRRACVDSVILVLCVL